MHGSIPDHTEPAKERDRICIYVSSAGNFFHSEMAELIARGLQNSGLFRVERRSESHEPDDSSLDIVVAPHEFYGLGSGTRFQEDRYRWFREQSNLFLSFVTAFSWPKFYELRRAQVDATIDVACMTLSQLLQALLHHATMIYSHLPKIPSAHDLNEAELEKKKL